MIAKGWEVHEAQRPRKVESIHKSNYRDFRATIRLFASIATIPVITKGIFQPSRHRCRRRE